MNARAFVKTVESNQLVDASQFVNSKRLKLLGGGRPKVPKAPKIRILAPGNVLVNILATLFRALNEYWFLYDQHVRCSISDKSQCVFCSFRSVSQYLNQPKREKSVHPYEISMLKELFVHEFNFDWTLDNNLDRLIGHTLTLLSLQMNERGIKKSLNDSDFCYIVCKGNCSNSIVQL